MVTLGSPAQGVQESNRHFSRGILQVAVSCDTWRNIPSPSLTTQLCGRHIYEFRDNGGDNDDGDGDGSIRYASADPSIDPERRLINSLLFSAHKGWVFASPRLHFVVSPKLMAQFSCNISSKLVTGRRAWRGGAETTALRWDAMWGGLRGVVCWNAALSSILLLEMVGGDEHSFLLSKNTYISYPTLINWRLCKILRELSAKVLFYRLYYC